MASHLYLAPAGFGKTSYVLARIRQTRAADPLTPILVILPNQAQVNAFRQRLSLSGGALGVNLGTFYTLYAEVLAWAGKPVPRLPEPVQYRLLRNLISQLSDAGRLLHYAPLRDKPGFVAATRALVEELKRARIRRDDFREAIQSLARPDRRLTELTQIYALYQDWLYDHGWADTEGQGWLAELALDRQPEIGRHLQLLIVDGFDEFNPTQLAVLKLLAERAGETIVTLTGQAERVETEAHGKSSNSVVWHPPAPIRWRRFDRARRAVSETLGLAPEALPQPVGSPFAPVLAHLEAHLFDPRAPGFHDLAPESDPASDAQTVTFLETQNRAEEVRAALRWLKAHLIRDGLTPTEVALIARDLAPYRPFIEETAAEFGLTLHLREALNLTANPAIAALMSLMALPLKTNATGNWARRLVIDAWRSPYFEKVVPGINRRAADRLNQVARQGLVMHGLDQWRAALDQQLRRTTPAEAAASPLADEEELYRPGQLAAVDAAALQSTFEAFVERVTPPEQATLHDYVTFVEDLIGDEPTLTVIKSKPQASGLITRAAAVPATAPRDLAALQSFKDVLRGLLLNEQLTINNQPEFSLDPSNPATFHSSGFAQDKPSNPSASLRTSLPSFQPSILPLLPYAQFYQELARAVQGATYYLPPPEPLSGALPVLSVLDARGLSFRAVALIGLAEGDFPRPEREDILLREEDRAALSQAGLAALDSRLRGDEPSLFYQAVTRARDKLLLCRPYLADDGQSWEASPYWQEVHRLVKAPVLHLRPEDPLPLSEAASPQEFLQAGGQIELKVETDSLASAFLRLQGSLAVLAARLATEPAGPYEGDLTALAESLALRYGPEHVWSSSRLEAYGLCPHHFWLWQDLALEPRQPPQEGFDIFILGSIYHEILEEVYRQAGSQSDRDQLLALLPPIAQQVFDHAPARYGFRPTALWEIQRPELEQIVARTLQALAEATADSTPMAQEQVFGLDDQPPLVARHNGEEFRLRGFIDRVDQLPDGRLRIIDYKSGSTPIAARDLVEGRRLQIALYALAARDALGLGEVADGFYWHIGSAKASSLKLGNFEGGLASALNLALTHALAHIAGVRAGRFAPLPPVAGCPSHCPGASFCWRYKGKGY